MWRTKFQKLAPSLAGAAAGLSGLSHLDRCRFNSFTRCHETSFSHEEYRKFPILEVRNASADTKVIKCGLPSPNHVMGLPVTSYVMVSGAKSGDNSAYTPITTDDQPGFFELLVKGYPEGNVSKYLCSLKEGNFISVQGPVKKLPYTANMKKKIGMIAGGSGITPMLQIIKEILKNPDDKTEVTLIFGNQTPQDILLREDLDQIAASSKGQVKIFYVVDENISNDPAIKHVGYLTADFCQGVLPAPADSTLVYVCGPPPMLKAVAGAKGFVQGRKFGQGHIGGLLEQLGYSIDMVFKF